MNEILIGDCRKLAKSIPDNSIDMIFTDPPYLKEFLWSYEFLSDLGARVLKPGGYCFAYGGVEHMPASLAGMGKSLDYFWVDSLVHKGGYPRVWYKKIMSGYKPVFCYTKGTPKKTAWRASVGSDAPDKRYHEWGQGIGYPVKIIELLTNEGDLILDPFCGGGQVPEACIITGRNYLAFEQSATTAEIAKSRLIDCQKPLLFTSAEQMELISD